MIIDRIVDFLDYTVKRSMEYCLGGDNYCNLSTMAHLSMQDVELLQDAFSLRNETEPLYLIIQYKSHHIATAYDSRLSKRWLPFSKDKGRIEEIWKVLESYYS